MISANGQRVAFQSNSDNLAGSGIQDRNRTSDIFVRDLNSRTTTLVSVSTVGNTTGDRASVDLAISGDGRYVAFVSTATNLVPGDLNGQQDVFVRDLAPGGVTAQLTRSPSNQGYNTLEYSSGPSTSYARPRRPRTSAKCSRLHELYRRLVECERLQRHAGRVPAQPERSPNRTCWSPHATPPSPGVTGMGSSTVGPRSVSADGRYVVFTSQAPNLTPDNPKAGGQHVFVRDLWNNTTTLVDINAAGVIGNGQSFDPVITQRPVRGLH